LPIKLPKGVEVKLEGETLTVKGPKGVLTRILDPQIKVELADGQLVRAAPATSPR